MSLKPSSSPAIAGSTTTISDLHSDILTRTLRLLDAPSLAAISSTSSHLRSLSSQPHLWLNLSLSLYPSLHHPRILPFLSSSPQSFFADIFPFPDPFAVSTESRPLPKELISAVDIHHRGSRILSRVIETETSSPWFRGSPFLIDATDREPEMIGMGVLPEELRMSWILIDPGMGRGVDVSSGRAVGVERNCYTGETMVRFATVVGERAIGAVVTLGEMGRIGDVVLGAEDMDGGCVSGEEAMEMVRGMMGAERRGRERERWEEEGKRRYGEFLKGKRRRKEIRARREGVLDLCCTAVGVAVFFAFLSMIVWG